MGRGPLWAALAKGGKRAKFYFEKIRVKIQILMALLFPY